MSTFLTSGAGVGGGGGMETAANPPHAQMVIRAVAEVERRLLQLLCPLLQHVHLPAVPRQLPCAQPQRRHDLHTRARTRMAVKEDASMGKTRNVWLLQNVARSGMRRTARGGAQGRSAPWSQTPRARQRALRPTRLRPPPSSVGGQPPAPAARRVAAPPADGAPSARAPLRAWWGAAAAAAMLTAHAARFTARSAPSRSWARLEHKVFLIFGLARGKLSGAAGAYDDGQMSLTRGGHDDHVSP